MSAPLPPCPLCGTAPRWGDTGWVHCPNEGDACPMWLNGDMSQDLWRRLAALRAEVGRLKDALDRQAAHYGGALSIEKARADKAERDASMLRRALNDAESALAAELKKADWLAAALRAALDTATRALEKIKERHIPTYSTNFEWMRDIANDHRRTAAAALAQIEGKKK